MAAMLSRPQCVNKNHVEICQCVEGETKQTLCIQTEMKCITSNINYMVECASCDIQYIGQTKRSLRHRFNNHRLGILNEHKTSIALHFNQHQCETNDNKSPPFSNCTNWHQTN